MNNLRPRFYTGLSVDLLTQFIIILGIVVILQNSVDSPLS